MLPSRCSRPSPYQSIPYICPKCQRRLNKSLSDTVTKPSTLLPPTSTLRSHVSSRTYAANGRGYSSSNSVFAEPAVAPLLQNINGESPPFRIRKYLKRPPVADFSLPKSDIRDRLKKWSFQNRVDKGLESGNEVLTGGSSKVLPMALFLDDEDLDDVTDEFDDDVGDEWDSVVAGENQLQLERGDLMIMKTNFTRKQYAIYLGTVETQAQFFLSDSRWLAGKIGHQATLHLSGFATEEDLAPLTPFLPKKSLEVEGVSDGEVAPAAFAGDVPSSAAYPLLLKLSRLAEDVLSFRRDNLAILESMYDNLADEDHHVTITLNDIVERLFHQNLEDMSDAAKMAIFHALGRDQIQMTITSQNYEYIPIVITPKSMMRRFQNVLDWARQYQEAAAQAAVGQSVASKLEDNPLTTFIEKARRLILKSRQIRSPTTIGHLGPSFQQNIQDNVVATESTGEEFSEEDKCIIEFLWHTFLRQPRVSTKSKNWSVASLILRATGAYPKLRLDDKVGKLLLQELGCVAPWAEASEENVTLPIPGRSGARESDRLLRESEILCDQLQLGENSATLPLPDAFADIRQDFGDIDVLAIDSKNTRVVDDGVSLEPVPDQPGHYWIHVHIAHCAAFTDRDHVIAKRAREVGTSLYTARTTYNMLPWRFAMATRLAPGAAALTLSMLVTDDGEVKQVKMRPTKVNKVISLDHDAVDHVLKIPRGEQASIFVGVSNQTNLPEEPRLEKEDIGKAEKHREILVKLQQLMEARRMARQKEVPVYANFPFAVNQRNVQVSFLEPLDNKRLFRSFHYRGDPAIKIECNRHETIGRLGEQEMNSGFVPSLMIFACESAGRWFKERQIPAPFVGSLTQPGFPLSRLNAAGFHDRVMQPVGRYDSVPIPHLLLNVAQYLRFTSPLRRYCDLMAHWQANAYLRAEADGLVVDGNPAPADTLPFTLSTVDKFLRKEIHMIKELDNLKSKTEVHWGYQAFFRAFHFKEADLPEVWDCKVVSFISSTIKRSGAEWGFTDTGIRAKLMPFGLNVMLIKSDEHWEDTCHINDYLPAKLEMVDLSGPTIFARAVGPASKTPTCLGPIKISSRCVDVSQDSSRLDQKKYVTT